MSEGFGFDFGSEEEDVPFDWGGADLLIAEFRATATVIEGQRGSRQSAGDHALIDWKGPHAEDFLIRRSTCDADAVQIAESLRRSATQVEDMRIAAREEQKRRELARDYLRVKGENQRLGEDASFVTAVEEFRMPTSPPPRQGAPMVLVPAPAIGGRR